APRQQQHVIKGQRLRDGKVDHEDLSRREGIAIAYFSIESSSLNARTFPHGLSLAKKSLAVRQVLLPKFFSFRLRLPRKIQPAISPPPQLLGLYVCHLHNLEIVSNSK